MSINNKKCLRNMDAKSQLTFWCARNNFRPIFVTELSGDGSYISKVEVESFEWIGIGRAISKKNAEKNACQNFIEQLEEAEQIQRQLSVKNNLTDASKSLEVMESWHSTEKFEKKKLFLHAKSFLCYWCRINNVTMELKYTYTGAPHCRIFICILSLIKNGINELIKFEATATSKKIADHLAARKAVKYLIRIKCVTLDEVKLINLDDQDEPEIPPDLQHDLLERRPAHSTSIIQSSAVFQAPMKNVANPPCADESLGSQSKSSDPATINEIKDLSSENVANPPCADESLGSRSNSSDPATLIEIKDLSSEMKAMSLKIDDGNWNLGVAKCKLHQFFQENKIMADYKYSSDSLKRYYEAHLEFTLLDIGKTFRATATAYTKLEASKKCALSIVRELYQANLIEPYTGTLKKEKPVPSSRVHEAYGNQQIF